MSKAAYYFMHYYMDYKRKWETERTKEVIRKMVTRSIAQKMGVSMQNAIKRASLGMISGGNEVPNNADEPTVEEL